MNSGVIPPSFRCLLGSAAVLLFVLPAFPAVLEWDPVPATPGAQGGAGTWDATTGHWWNGDANQAWADGSDAIFGGTAGAVTLSATRTAASLAVLSPGYALRLGERILTIQGSVSGLPFDYVETAGAKAQTGIRFRSSENFTGRAYPASFNGWVTLWAENGAEVTLSGKWNGASGAWGSGSAGSSSYSFLRMSQGARFVFAPSFEINNNNADLINARGVFVVGTGWGEVLECDPLFDADHTGYDLQLPPNQQTDWVANGLSTINIVNATYITHATRNLPSIHKKAGDGSYTHHGLITFSPPSGVVGTNALWIVRSAAQEYDGGINWSFPWTLRTEEDLTFTGQYSIAAKVAYGTRGSVGTWMRKEGASALILDGTQGYCAGAGMVVAEGSVRFNTDPGDPGALYLQTHWPTSNPGQFLQLNVLAGAVAEFNVPRSGLQSLELAGSGIVYGGRVEVTGAVVLHPSSALSLVASDLDARLDSGSAVSLGGTITVADPGLPPGSYPLITAAGGISGSFASSVLPPGCTLTYAPNQVLLEVVGAGGNQPPTASSVAVETLEGSPVAVLLAGSDPEGAPLSFAVTSTPASGQISGTAPDLIYAPNSGFSGTDSLTYRVSDGQWESAEATVQITVVPVNDPPVIAPVADVSVDEDGVVPVIAISVSDPDHPAEALVLTASSGNEALVPAGGLSLGGTGATRFLTITPAPNQSGSAVIQLTVSDGITTAGVAFTVTVLPVNDPPTISDLPDREAVSGVSTGSIAFTVGDVETVAGSLAVSAVSDNATLVPAAGMVLGGGGASRTLAVTPASGQTGSALITVSVSDGQAVRSDTFVLAVVAPSLPPPWLAQGIGNPGLAGSASATAGVFTVTGGGSDIWGSSDKFHFVHRTMTGDGEIRARVTSQQNTHGWAKAGVMIRESLAANSRHAFLCITPSNGYAWQRRTSTGGSSATTGGGTPNPQPNNWVRIVRAGNTFTASRSADGITWTQVGSPVTISMAQNVSAGLAVTSHDKTKLSTVLMDSVTFVP